MSRIRLATVALILSSGAWASGWFGPSVDPQFQTMTLSAGAGAGGTGWDLTLPFFWFSSVDAGTHTLHEIWLRTGTEYVRDQWIVSIEDENHAVLRTWTQSLTPDSWNRLPLPTDLVIPFFSGEWAIRLKPQSSGRIDFLSAFRQEGRNGVWGLEPPPSTLGFLYTEGHELDGGTGYYTAIGSAAVLVFSDTLDPFPPSECDAGLFEASGQPYIFPSIVHVDGGSAKQTFGYVSHRTDPNALGAITLALSNITAERIDWEIARNGSTIAGGGVDPVQLKIDLPCTIPFLPDPSAKYALTLRAIDGGFDWLTASAGPGLSACDPPARATFGGSDARAIGDPAGDFVFAAELAPINVLALDSDSDGFGAPDSGDYRCAGPATSSTYDDCDDTRFDVHPNASEVCDGIDQNCDGVIDDSVTDSPACEKFQGVCAGSTKPASLCIDGGWSACTAAQYGPLYESPETVACDGVDNDCDGTIAQKHRCERQLGPCRGKFVDVCFLENGECQPKDYGPWFEDVERTCDGIDNDCDGVTDGLALPCPLQEGVCSGSHAPLTACTDAGWAACAPADYGDEYEPVETRCDGKDNDCDGTTDEGCLTTEDPAPRRCGCEQFDALIPLGLLAILRAVARVRSPRDRRPRPD
ncbi:MAG: putative metal-binding motif-containing protein [Myxococcaceae bacterium]